MNFGRLYTESWIRSASASWTVFIVACTTCSVKRVDMWCRYFCFKECYDKRINLIPLQRSLLIVKDVAYLINKIMKYWEFENSIRHSRPENRFGCFKTTDVSERRDCTACVSETLIELHHVTHVSQIRFYSILSREILKTRIQNC